MLWTKIPELSRGVPMGWMEATATPCGALEPRARARGKPGRPNLGPETRFEPRRTVAGSVVDGRRRRSLHRRVLAPKVHRLLVLLAHHRDAAAAVLHACRAAALRAKVQALGDLAPGYVMRGDIPRYTSKLNKT